MTNRSITVTASNTDSRRLIGQHPPAAHGDYLTLYRSDNDCVRTDIGPVSVLAPSLIRCPAC
ncbi:MAG: hypothetical protein MK179_08535 [Pirellulaceae bacterium]|nr:hypothetical protein [Pirellulaceae bacterium]